jgi:hypothetical protein
MLGLIFDGLVTVATVVGVVFLVLQWDQTGRALVETQRQISLDNRPIIMVRSREKDPKSPDIFKFNDARSVIVWSFDVVNYGRFPATADTARFRVLHGTRASVAGQIEDFFRTLPPQLSSGCNASGMIFPDNAEPMFRTAQSTDTVTQAQLRIEYCGLADDRHRTDFCYWKLATGATQQCAVHNQISELSQPHK